MKKLIIVLCLLFGLAVLWMSRYSIYAGPQMAYKLDRLTGEVRMIYVHRGPNDPFGILREYRIGEEIR